MSSFNLAKKLLPAKKAWKSFKNLLQSKFHRFKSSKAIKRSKELCLTVLRSIKPLILSKLYALTRSPTHTRFHVHEYHHYHHHQQQQQQQQLGKSFSVIYVDELFPEPAPSTHSLDHIDASSSGASMVKAEMTSDGKEKQQNIAIRVGKIVHPKALPRELGNANEASSSSAFGDKSKIAFLPQFKGVDERAEEFISKFREEMKIQRQQSLLDFQEMLTRSA